MKKCSLSLFFATVIAGPAVAQVTTLHDFGDGAFGSYPDFLTVSGSNLYGIARQSPSGGGALFSVSVFGTLFTVHHTFDHDSQSESYPGQNIRYLNGALYGFKSATFQPKGAMYRQPIGGQQTNLHEFGIDHDGAYPADLTGFGSEFFGVTAYGGIHGGGTVFRIFSDGSGYRILHTFDGVDAFVPSSILLSGSDLFGTTSSGGPGNLGTVFRADTLGLNLSVLHTFEANGDGGPLYARVVTIQGTKLYGNYGVSGKIFRMGINGANFELLNTFPGGTLSSFIVRNDLIYGTARVDSFDEGVVFKMKLDGGAPVVLHQFTGTDGSMPTGLVLSDDGKILYGVTTTGGIDSRGTVFSLPTKETIVTVPPSIILNRAGGAMIIEFSGVLQSSTDLNQWTDVNPQPTSPWNVAPGTGKMFYRARAAN